MEVTMKLEDGSVTVPKYTDLRRCSGWSTIDWLSARQEMGMHRNSALRCDNSILESPRLASVAAWNASRIQNMILAVGPGTPASVLWGTSLDREDEESSDESEVFASRVSRRSSTTDSDDSASDNNTATTDDSDHPTAESMQQTHADEKSEASENSSEESGMEHEFIHAVMEQAVVRVLADQQQSREDEEEDDDDDEDEGSSEAEIMALRGERSNGWNGWSRSARVQPSMRHGGCINTACWMECPWQVASSGDQQSSNSSPFDVDPHECTTQLLTSGDDRLVKVWDAKYAMGMVSPLEGGWDTYTPLAYVKRPNASSAKKSWSSYYLKQKDPVLAGSVVHLATLVTGHRGNVFHVTPVNSKPGMILTCAADGSLRLSDMMAGASTLVRALGDRSHFLLQSTMAFSHVFLTENTGLLCSEEGLHRFDLRLSHRAQERRSLLSGLGGCFEKDDCKSCAVWSPHAGNGSDNDVESNYVFAGGRSEQVALIDLRAVGGSRIVETYRPRGLRDTHNVSVSGLDVSKDARELLVSYESDQIYSFPILPNKPRGAPPSLKEIDDRAESPNHDVRELASYGGHLNRFTFLKNARFAGPNDDYICTGSDSGCAWIYERKSGAAVSLLGADKCTCNGLVPHNSLPVFVSYGIDSTAKLWRASRPINRQVDDSSVGRVKCALEQSYEMSPVTRSWQNVRRFVEREASPGIFPDFVASPSEAARSSNFAQRESTAIDGASSSIFGNALRLLPSLLRRNRYECYRHAQRSSESHRTDTPVEQPVEDFSHRVSISRLRLQADRFGLQWNQNMPWAFDRKISVNNETTVHAAETVPDNPSDWILLDGRMDASGSDAYRHANFNNEDHAGILHETFGMDNDFQDVSLGDDVPPWLKDHEMPSDEEIKKNQWLLRSSDERVARSRRWLLATINLLKVGGNEAIREGDFATAARRYDKALQYCAYVLMDHDTSGVGDYSHLKCLDPSGWDSDSDDEDEPGRRPQWTPVVHALGTLRLNMAFLMLRPEFANPNEAASQATQALRVMDPFVTGQQKDADVLALKAKAHFRLGSAKLEQGYYGEAVQHFEASVKDSKNCPAGKPDKLVVSRLQEAKRKLKRKKERDQDRYKRALRRVSKDAKS